MNNIKTALVTGVTGFIGSALVRRLVSERVKVFCIVRTAGRDYSSLEGLPGVELINIKSFRKEEISKSLAGIRTDIVINLASYGVSQEDLDPEIMIEGNVNVVTSLLLATADWSLKKFIHTGSCSEYGESPGESLTENHSLQPTSLYGAAKAASVIYGNAFAIRLGIPFITLRLFGVYGVGEGRSRLVPFLIDCLKKDKPVNLTYGEQVRDFLYIDDVINAYVLAARSSGIVQNTVYNVCSGRPTRVRDVAEAVADIMKKPKELLLFGNRPYRPDESMYIVGDNTQFCKATDWKPEVTLYEGIRKMIEAANDVVLRGLSYGTV